MLKSYGNISANNKQSMNELDTALQNAGFQIAYVNDVMGTIVKQVPDLQYDEEEINNA